MIYLPVMRAWVAILIMATLNLVLSLNQWQYKTLRELKEIKTGHFLVFVTSSPNT
jgi:HAMP domain-containing protein